MYWVVVFIMAVGATGVLAWPLLRSRRSDSRRSPALWVLAFTVPLLALGLAAYLRDDQSGVIATSMDIYSMPWPGGSTMTQPVAEEPTTSAPPVSSLVDGLQARLEENPEDVNGWALLAQSYAFMVDGPRAEEAIANAVELGFDEADLRNRVELASQSSRTLIDSERQLDWVQRAIADRAPRP